MISTSKVIWVAAPYVTVTEDLLAAQQAGKIVQLIVGLNDCTSPTSLRRVHLLPNFAIRYFTRRFHAKLYVFDDQALVGSSNLTQGGLTLNREANIRVDSEDELDEIRALFSELWEDAQVLTEEKLAKFETAWSGKRGAMDPDPRIENAVGQAEPQNSSVASRKRSTETTFLETLRRHTYEYSTAFREIDTVLVAEGIGREELKDVGSAHRTNRFLNWVRLVQAPGEEAWRNAPIRDSLDRHNLIKQLGHEWSALESDSTQIPEDYLAWLERVKKTFGTKDAIAEGTKEQLTSGLLALHAFHEQLRFVDGGLKNLPTAFWTSNKDDLERVRRSFLYLLYGPDDFVVRLYELFSDPKLKIGYFGKFCGLELLGTIRPNICPPMNGRTAKGMKFLGYAVSAG